MMPLYEFNCMAHGKFDKLMSSSEATPRCPHGCSPKLVSKMVTAANFISDRTRNIDSTLRGMAQEHGLTDMNNHGGDTGVFQPDRNFLKAQSNMQQQILSGQTFAGQMASGDNAIQNTLTQGGYRSDNALESVKPLLEKPKVIVHGSYTPKEMPKVE